MDLQTLTYIVVGASFALYIGIAIWARAGSTGEFYAAGRGIHPVANGMATAADWMSAASFISMAGLIAFRGYDASIFLMGWTGGYVLLAMLLAPYLRKFGKFTVPEFIGDRYYSQAARIVAVVAVVAGPAEAGLVEVGRVEADLAAGDRPAKATMTRRLRQQTMLALSKPRPKNERRRMPRLRKQLPATTIPSRTKTSAFVHARIVVSA